MSDASFDISYESYSNRGHRYWGGPSGSYFNFHLGSDNDNYNVPFYPNSYYGRSYDNEYYGNGYYNRDYGYNDNFGGYAPWGGAFADYSTQGWDTGFNGGIGDALSAIDNARARAGYQGGSSQNGSAAPQVAPAAPSAPVTPPTSVVPAAPAPVATTATSASPADVIQQNNLAQRVANSLNPNGGQASNPVANLDRYDTSSAQDINKLAAQKEEAKKINKLAEELGLHPNSGESFDDFKKRVKDAQAAKTQQQQQTESNSGGTLFGSHWLNGFVNGAAKMINPVRWFCDVDDSKVKGGGNAFEGTVWDGSFWKNEDHKWNVHVNPIKTAVSVALIAVEVCSLGTATPWVAAASLWLTRILTGIATIQLGKGVLDTATATTDAEYQAAGEEVGGSTVAVTAGAASLRAMRVAKLAGDRTEALAVANAAEEAVNTAAGGAAKTAEQQLVLDQAAAVRGLATQEGNGGLIGQSALRRELGIGVDALNATAKVAGVEIKAPAAASAGITLSAGLAEEVKGALNRDVNTAADLDAAIAEAIAKKNSPLALKLINERSRLGFPTPVGERLLGATWKGVKAPVKALKHSIGQHPMLSLENTVATGVGVNNVQRTIGGATAQSTPQEDAQSAIDKEFDDKINQAKADKLKEVAKYVVSQGVDQSVVDGITDNDESKPVDDKIKALKAELKKVYDATLVQYRAVFGDNASFGDVNDAKNQIKRAVADYTKLANDEKILTDDAVSAWTEHQDPSAIVALGKKAKEAAEARRIATNHAIVNSPLF